MEDSKQNKQYCIFQFQVAAGVAFITKTHEVASKDVIPKRKQDHASRVGNHSSKHAGGGNSSYIIEPPPTDNKERIQNNGPEEATSI